jgi:hypothetical protein
LGALLEEARHSLPDGDFFAGFDASQKARKVLLGFVDLDLHLVILD